MQELSECLVCSNRNFKLYAESTFTGTVTEAPQFFLANRRGVVHGTIVQCELCGFRFTNPQFTPGQYDQIYSSVMQSSIVNKELLAASARRFRRLAKYVREDLAARDRFLDFGCGRGGFLVAMNNPAGLGFEVGEPGSFPAGPSKVVTGSFFDLLGHMPFEFGAFDFISAFEVFEHLAELDQYITALGRLLAPGGKLVVTVPDLGSWAASVAGARWNMYLLEHLWYFDRKTLAKLMSRLGFRETGHRKFPYDATLPHLLRRAGQTYNLRLDSASAFLPNVVLPIPAGMMYSVFEKAG